jgi:hypothetical protein
MVHHIQQLNSGLAEPVKSKIESQIERRAEAGCLCRNDPARLHESVNDTQAVVTSSMRNLEFNTKLFELNLPLWNKLKQLLDNFQIQISN